MVCPALLEPENLKQCVYLPVLANSTAISNQTSNTITLTMSQVGANITCNVTAYNVAGNSSPATSNSLGPVIQGVTASYLIVAGGGGSSSQEVIKNPKEERRMRLKTLRKMAMID